MTPEELQRLEQVQKNISAGKAAAGVLEYLQDYFKLRREVIFRNLCNAEPTLEKLLDVKAQARNLALLEQELTIQKTTGLMAENEPPVELPE